MKTYNKFLGNLVKNNKEYALVFDSDITLNVAHRIQTENITSVEIRYMSKEEFKLHPDAVGAIKKHEL